MKKIKHIFFDLDHTIWDFEKNSSEALSELFFEFGFDKETESAEAFVQEYQKINAVYWRKYRTGEISKDTVRVGRFLDTLKHFEISQPEHKAIELGNRYIEISPKKSHLFPFAHETLVYLKKKYPLHIITNGFMEVVKIKLHHSNLSDYFDVVVCAEDVGEKKPHPSVFEMSMKKAGTSANESVMIGDNYEVDIEGAEQCGMKTIFFNPTSQKIEHQTTEIRCLSELQGLL